MDASMEDPSRRTNSIPIKLRLPQRSNPALTDGKSYASSMFSVKLPSSLMKYFVPTARSTHFITVAPLLHSRASPGWPVLASSNYAHPVRQRNQSYSVRRVRFRIGRLAGVFLAAAGRFLLGVFSVAGSAAGSVGTIGGVSDDSVRVSFACGGLPGPVFW